jgi:hypothetical protein
MEPWNLQINGRGNTPDLAKNERFQKAFATFVQDLDAIGLKIETANLDYAGHATNVLGNVHVHA